MLGSDPISIYLHIPFCHHRCAYCDFNTYTGLNDLRADYVASLCKEIEQVGNNRIIPVHTVFFGGGTPSLLSPEFLERVLDTIYSTFNVRKFTEITLEANPDTVSYSYLKEINSLGINRLSYGVQSAIESELTLLERTHNFSTAIEAVLLARSAGIRNINLDLIYGLPNQSLASWESSLRQVVELNPDHLSLYCLTIEPGTRMHRWLQNGSVLEPDPDLAAEQYRLACRLLAEAGFTHYEISNWSLPGRECRHNLAYWRNDPYLGFGAGAHGHANRYRYWVVKQPRVYIRRLAGELEPSFPWSSAVSGKEKLSTETIMSETMITQLRLLEDGLALNNFKEKFGLHPTQAFPGVIEKHIAYGLLVVDGDRLRLSEAGWLLSNQVFVDFM